MKKKNNIENMSEELIGREFDWFAIDKNGDFGMFSSAGSGIIPSSVIEDFKSHDSIAEIFELPNFGSENVWEDFANYGFYIYDWEINKGPYKKVSEPKTKISQKLKIELLELKSLFKIDLAFENTKDITIEL